MEHEHHGTSFFVQLLLTLSMLVAFLTFLYLRVRSRRRRELSFKWPATKNSRLCRMITLLYQRCSANSYNPSSRQCFAHLTITKRSPIHSLSSSFQEVLQTFCRGEVSTQEVTQAFTLVWHPRDVSKPTQSVSAEKRIRSGLSLHVPVLQCPLCDDTVWL